MNFPIFSEFYEALTGNKPFNWQVEFANKLCEGQWFGHLGYPPGVGKTGVIAAWYYALADSLSKKERHIPIRLHYIVNRRVIIDAGYEFAKKLQDGLANNPVLQAVAKRVCEVLKTDTPLAIGKMRGGLERGESNQWCINGTYTPNIPAIVSSSIDQFGSRLLFRGYSVNSKAQSIHASMMAIDSLIILDESHLSEALQQTIGRVNAQAKTLIGKIPPTRTLTLSATGSNDEDASFPLSFLDGDERIATRLNALRPIKLVRIESDKQIVKTLASEASALIEAGLNVVGVVCNTVNIARSTYKILSNNKSIQVILLTGRVRAAEREALFKKYIAGLLSGRDRSKANPIILVCTQTIEVGVDLDLDGMVRDSIEVHRRAALRHYE